MSSEQDNENDGRRTSKIVRFTHTGIEIKVAASDNSLYDKSYLCLHYLLLFVLGLLSWGLLWFIWGDNWGWNGAYFRVMVVASVAWGSSLCIQSLIKLLPLQFVPLVVGIVAGNLGYLDMRDDAEIDVMFRKFIPVVILGKSGLMWDFDYMKANCINITLLGTIPWAMEVMTVFLFSFYVFELPVATAMTFGIFYSCVCVPIVVPIIMGMKMELTEIRGWMAKFCNSAAVDMTLSVVLNGMIRSVTNTKVDFGYRIVKFCLTPLVGLALGVSWGFLASVIPHPHDYYFNELRILVVFMGGLFANFLAIHFDWGGTAYLAILTCNATAMRLWAKKGWVVLSNPATVGYRAMWSAFEPALFAFTGTFFMFDKLSSTIVIRGLTMTLLCLVVRGSMVFIVCRKNTIKERLFVCSCWCTKGILQAIIGPIRITNFIVSGGATETEKHHADLIVSIIVVTLLLLMPLCVVSTSLTSKMLIKEAQMRRQRENPPQE